MAELSTLGLVIKRAYEEEPDTNAFTDDYAAKLSSTYVFTLSEKDKLAQTSVFTVDEKTKLADTFTFTEEEKLKLATLSPAAPVRYPDILEAPDFLLANLRSAANGVAPLDASGKVPAEFLNVSGLAFKGPWSPVTGLPSLVDGTGTVGDFYKATQAGEYSFGGQLFAFQAGDWAIFAGGTWQRISVSDSVAMVNGRLGAVVLTAADVGALPSTYQAPVKSVNGKTGDITLTAANVGALPSTYAPTWTSVTGKPAFDTLYQAKQRGAIGPAIPAVLARLTADRNIATGVETALAWGTMLYDTFNTWNGTTGFVVPTRAKFVRATVSLQFWGDAPGERQSSFRVGGSNVIGSGVVRQNSPGANPFVSAYSTAVIPVTTGQVLTVSVFQTSGTTRPIQNTNATWVQLEFFEAIT